MTKENKKLKVCLEELQAKLRQVMEKSSCTSRMKSYEAFFDVLVGTDSLRDCSIKASFPELPKVKSEELGKSSARSHMMWV